MQDATSRQLDVLRLIGAHQRLRESPPSIRWLQDQLGCASPNGVVCHVLALRKKGLLDAAGGNVARQYTLTDAGWAAIGMMSPTEIELALYAYHLGSVTVRAERGERIESHFRASFALEVRAHLTPQAVPEMSATA